MQAQLIYHSMDETGEGAYWHVGSASLLWVDIDNGILHTYSLSNGQVTDMRLPGMVSTIIPMTGSDKEILLAVKDKFLLYNLEKKTYCNWLDLSFIKEDFRTNDGKASPEGRIWLGVMHLSNHKETGSLYCIDSDMTHKEILTGQSIPNGIVWNKTGDTMYYADSGKGCIYAFDYDKEKGTVFSSRIAVQVPAKYGIPDGMTIDGNGNLWVAHWGGFGVYIWNPHTGELLNKIEVPVPNVASCTFGGKKREKLFITTARSGLTEQEKEQYPLSGGLFAIDTTVVAGENHYPFLSI